MTSTCPILFHAESRTKQNQLQPFLSGQSHTLVNSIYDQLNGKSGKSEIAKITTWYIRTDIVRKRDRGQCQ